MLATKILGPTETVELRGLGGDRLAALDQGADLVMTVDTTAAHDRALISVPYAGAAIAITAKEGGTIRRIEDIGGQAIAVGQDELGARDVAQTVLQQRGIQATLANYMGVSGAIAAVEDGKAVAIIGDSVGLALVGSSRGLTLLAELAKRPYVVAARKSAPKLAAAIDDALKSLLASGEIRTAAVRAGFPYASP